MALAAVSTAAAQVADGPSRTSGARDLFGLQVAGDPQVRPDGDAFSVGRGGLIAFTAGDASHPADLAMWRGGKTQRLTRLNDGLFEGKTLARVEHLPVVSSSDRSRSTPGSPRRPTSTLRASTR